MAVLAAVLAASLFGSLHCAGMCGPLVAFALGGGGAESWRRRTVLQCGYHGARLLTYVACGAVFGMLGAAFDLGGAMVGLHRLASTLAGLMMVAVGLVTLVQLAGVRLPHLLPTVAPRLLMAGHRLAAGLRPLPRATTIGALTAFLPCGWLYAFALVAAGTGTPWYGAGVMAAFWLGTIPVLVSLGLGVQSLLGAFGRRLPMATALVIVGLGLYTLVERQSVAARTVELSRSVLPAQDLEQRVSDISHKTPPCCQARKKTVP